MSKPGGKKSLRRLAALKASRGSSPTGGSQRPKASANSAAGGAGSPALAICSASCSICACHSAGRRGWLTQRPAGVPAGVLRCKRPSRPRPPWRTTLARSSHSGWRLAASATRASGRPQGSQGRVWPGLSAASARNTCQARALRCCSAPTSGRPRHSPGQTSQSKRTASAMRQSSNAAASVTRPSSQALRSQESMPSSAAVSTLTGCSSRTPSSGSVAAAAGTSAPNAAPMPRSRKLGTAFSSPSSTPLPLEKKPGGATTGTSASRHSSGRVSTRSSPLTARPRPAVMRNCTAARPLVPGSGSSDQSTTKPSTMPATQSWPRSARWPWPQAWRCTSAAAVRARPGNKLGRRRQTVVASSAVAGDRPMTRSPASGLWMGRMLTGDLHAGQAGQATRAPTGWRLQPGRVAPGQRTRAWPAAGARAAGSC